MSPATFFRKLKTSKPAPPSGGSPDTPVVPFEPVAAATTISPQPLEQPAAMSAEARPVPGAPSPKPPHTPFSKPAARLVEAGRSRSSKLRGDLKGLFRKAEPWHKPAAAAAALLTVAGLGYGVGHAVGGRSDAQALAASRWAEASAEIRRNRDESLRLAGDMKAVRTTVDALKAERDRSRGDMLGRPAQLALEKNVGKLGEQLERIEKAQRDPARLIPLTERLDRLERQIQASSGPTSGSVASAPASPPSPATAPTVVSSAPTPPPKPTSGLDVTQTGSIPETKPDQRKTPVDGYVLREIDDGYALVEARNGRYFEVAPGMSIPGLGRVEAIERRGRNWVVVTSKGYIGER